jgi:hypothetical protein
VEHLRADLERGVTEVREGNFERGIGLLEPATQRMSQAGETASAARGYIYLAMARFELGQEAEAKKAVRQAWSIAPNLQLSGEAFAPRFMEFFKETRNEIEKEQKGSRKKMWLVVIPVVALGVAIGIASSMGGTE